jgi:hypothetical protein
MSLKYYQELIPGAPAWVHEQLAEERAALEAERQRVEGLCKELRDQLVLCFTHFGREIERLPLTESAALGIQQLSRDCARILDRTPARLGTDIQLMREELAAAQASEARAWANANESARQRESLRVELRNAEAGLSALGQDKIKAGLRIHDLVTKGNSVKSRARTVRAGFIPDTVEHIDLDGLDRAIDEWNATVGLSE